MSLKLFSEWHVISAIAPLDLQTARTGDVISTKNYSHVAVVFFKGAGTAGDDPVLTFAQGTDVAFGTNKALTVAEFWQAQQTLLTSDDTFTRVTQTASETVSLDGTSAEKQGIYIFEFAASDFDSDGGYDCLRVAIGDTGGNAQLGCVLYFGKLKHCVTPASHATAITD